MRSILHSEDRTTLGVVTIVVIVLVVVAVNTGWLYGQFQPSGEIVRAQFADTAQLKINDKVRVAGIDVGRVESIDLDPGGRTATVEMLIQDEARPVYRDARAALRFRTLLGGSFAIDLDRGTPSAGDLGAKPIPASRTTSQVEVEDVVSTIQGDSKQGLRELLSETPEVLADPQQPAAALRELETAGPAAGTAISAVRGRGESDLRPLIASAARTVRALDTPVDDLKDVVQGAAATMATTARRATDLQAVIERGANVQPEAQATLAQLRGTLRTAEPVVDRLRAPARQVAATLRTLQPTVVEADELIERAEPLVDRLRPAVSALASTARRGTPLLRDLEPGIKRLVDTVLPELAERDKVTKLRTYEIIGPTIASLNSSASTFDREGHLFRFPALGGQRALSDEIPCASFLTDPETEAIVRCQDLNEALSDYATWMPKLLEQPRGAK